MNFEKAYKKALETKCPMYLPKWNKRKYLIVRENKYAVFITVDEDLIWTKSTERYSPTKDELISKRWKVVRGMRLSTATKKAIKKNKFVVNYMRLSVSLKLKPTDEGLLVFKNNISREKKSSLENGNFLTKTWFVID